MEDLHASSEISLRSPEEFSERIAKIRHSAESFNRLCGYYRIDYRHIGELRSRGFKQEQVINYLSDIWYDKSSWDSYNILYPIVVKLPELIDLPLWEDYEKDASYAHEILSHDLIGGESVGHTVYAMSQADADVLAAEFISLFDNPKLYTGMGWSDPHYTFENGILLVDDNYAGIFLIVESD